MESGIPQKKQSLTHSLRYLPSCVDDIIIILRLMHYIDTHAIYAARVSSMVNSYRESPQYQLFLCSIVAMA